MDRIPCLHFTYLTTWAEMSYVYFFLGGRFCAWVDVTCVQGGSLFPSSQGWVLSVLKKGMWLLSFLLHSNIYSLCVVLSSAKLALLGYLFSCLFFGVQVCAAVIFLQYTLEHMGEMVPGLDLGGRFGKLRRIDSLFLCIGLWFGFAYSVYLIDDLYQ